MQVEIFTLCDAATIQNGKLNILGTFDTLTFPEFPGRWDSFRIAVRVRFGPEEGNAHHMLVRWIDSDGDVVDETGVCSFEINYFGGNDVYQYIWYFREKEFFREGEYLLELVIDDSPAGVVPLTVKMSSQG